MRRGETTSRDCASGSHRLLWLVLTLFPVSLTGSGDVNAAQIMLHGTMAVLLVVLVFIRGFNSPASLPAGFFTMTLILVSGALGYFAVLSSMNAWSGATGDVLDVFRPLVYFAYFSAAFLLPLDTRDLRRLITLLLALAAFQVLFSALVYWPAAWEFVNLYKGRTSTDSVVFHFFRWSGTDGYPSDFAFYLSFFFYLLFLSRHRFLSWPIHYGLLALTGFGILMTMSRGGLATVAVMTVVGAVLFGRVRLLIVSTAAAAALVGGLLVLERGLDQDVINTSYVFDLVERGTEAESARHRVEEVGLAIEYAGRQFPFGYGAARDEIYSKIRVIESLYGHYLIKWGILGLGLFLVSIAWLMRAAWVVWDKSPDLVVRYFGGAYFLLVLSVPLVFGLSSAVTDRYKCLPFFYLLAGYIAREYESLRAASRAATVPDAPIVSGTVVST